MNAQQFKESLTAYFDAFQGAIATETGEWVVKGFIDVYKNIYTISVDTKVVSKIVELMLFPLIARFAEERGYRMVLSEHQNHYPDITFIDQDGTMIALDVKSTYRTSATTVNGFTLGAFTGYFRDRHSHKNTTFPYAAYTAHVVLGVIYSRADAAIDERRVYKLDELLDIISVARDFRFLVQEKWRIAGDGPGSGNTKNIGSALSLRALCEGNGPFAPYGEKVFDDYWMNYLTADMARAIDSPVPFRNLREYLKWRDLPTSGQNSRT